jgi:hypothetical protein
MSTDEKIDLLLSLVDQLNQTVAEQGEKLEKISGERRIPIAEAAKRLNLQPATLRVKVKSGEIKCCPRKAPGKKRGSRGGRIYFLEEHLAEYEGRAD